MADIKFDVTIPNETTKQSLVRDVFTFTGMAAIITLAWWLDMRGLASSLLIIGLFAGAAAMLGKSKGMTPDEMREVIEALDGAKQKARIAELEGFLADFYHHDFTDATKGWPRHPDDEDPSPLTDARTVWDMQKEARELLKGGK